MEIVMNKVQKQNLIDWVVINPEGKVIAWIKKQRNGGYVLEYKGISGRWQDFYITFSEAEQSAKTLET